MSAHAWRNGRIHVPGGWLEGHALVGHAGRIEALLPEGDPRLRGLAATDLAGALLLPGFIDVQVNGGGGVLFNDAPTVDGLRAMGAAHARFGTTGFLPTLISDGADRMARALAAADAAIEADVPGVLGIHLEGPWLNPARKGVHDAAVLRAPGAALPFAPLRHGRTLVTLAPECCPDSLLRALHAAGVIMAAGHTDATAEQVEQACRNGLTGFTHLFNAMSPLAARAPGAVGAALLADGCWCGLIVDGRHVDPRTLRIALRAHPAERFMLVTDAMPCVGTGAREFMLQGKRIHVGDGWCVDEAGTLAGTSLDMSRCVRNAIAMLGVDAHLAVRMASEFPADFLGLSASHGRIVPGARADLVATDGAFNVRSTWIGGTLAASA